MHVFNLFDQLMTRDDGLYLHDIRLYINYRQLTIIFIYKAGSTRKLSAKF